MMVLAPLIGGETVLLLLLTIIGAIYGLEKAGGVYLTSLEQARRHRHTQTNRLIGRTKANPSIIKRILYLLMALGAQRPCIAAKVHLNFDARHCHRTSPDTTAVAIHYESYCSINDEGHLGDLLATTSANWFCLPHHQFAEPQVRHEENFILPHGSATSTSIVDGQGTWLATEVQTPTLKSKACAVRTPRLQWPIPTSPPLVGKFC